MSVYMAESDLNRVANVMVSWLLSLVYLVLVLVWSVGIVVFFVTLAVI